MVTKNRDALKTLFGNDAIPTVKNFESLIDSMLNKRDDMFFGKWRSGIGYNQGDVVLYNDRLYYFTDKAHDPKKDLSNEEKKCECTDGDCCGNNPPGSCHCWQYSKIDTNDHDWEFVFDNHQKKIGMYSMVSSGVGIGTGVGKKPEGLLHLSGESSQFVFDPTGSASPVFKIINAPFTPDEALDDDLEKNADFVSHQLAEEKVIIDSNTLGFLFRRFLPNEIDETTTALQADNILDNNCGGLSLLFVTSDNTRPLIGIGTESPQAMLDVKDSEQRQIHLNPLGKSEPELILINLDSESAANFLSTSLGGNQAVFSTDAPHGFAFKVSKQSIDFQENQVVIDGNGNVGIGTETPVNKLDARTDVGSIQFSLDESNPSINIINLRPVDDTKTPTIEGANYLTLGANNDEAIFSTDSKNGFIFKKGEINNSASDINIDDGQAIFCLQPTDFEKGLFNAIMNGSIMSQGFYIESAPERPLPPISPTDALDLIRDLNLYKFQDGTHQGVQYGFKAANVNETKQGVKKIPNSPKKYIAYHNLVGLLVATVRGLDERIKKLEFEKSPNPKK